MKKLEINKKIDFVNNMNSVITQYIPNIDKLNYVVFENITNEKNVVEFLVITFKGGAISVRNCSGDSCLGILQEISKLADGVYYDEVDYFEKYLNDCRYQVINK